MLYGIILYCLCFLDACYVDVLHLWVVNVVRCIHDHLRMFGLLVWQFVVSISLPQTHINSSHLHNKIYFFPFVFVFFYKSTTLLKTHGATLGLITLSKSKLKTIFKKVLWMIHICEFISGQLSIAAFFHFTN